VLYGRQTSTGIFVRIARDDEFGVSSWPHDMLDIRKRKRKRRGGGDKNQLSDAKPVWSLWSGSDDG